MTHKFLKFYESFALTGLPEYFGLDKENLSVSSIINNLGNCPVTEDYNIKIQNYWKNKNVRYDLNEHEFRTSHKFENLKDNEFILAVGCSITMGVGIDEDSRWSNQIEKSLNIPVVNLGVGGSDIHTAIRNVCSYIRHYSKPKAIIVQIPELTRFSFLKSNGISRCNSYFNIYNFDHYKAPKIELQGADYHFNQEVAIQQLVMLQTVFSAFCVPVIYFTVRGLDLSFYDKNKVDNYTSYHTTHDCTGVVSALFPDDIIYDLQRNEHNEYDFKKYEGVLMDYGRDLMHPGDFQNTVWAECLTRILLSKI